MELPVDEGIGMIFFVEAIQTDDRAVGADAGLPRRLVKGAAPGAKTVLIIIVPPASFITLDLLHGAASLLFLLS